MKIKRYWIFLLLLFGLTGCAVEERMETEAARHKETVIPIIYAASNDESMKDFEDMVNGFNEHFAGEYRVEVEWYNAKTHNYRTLIKRLNVIDELPAVLTDVAFLPSFYEMLKEDGRLVDLAPYIMEDEEWLSVIDRNVLESCTEKDGKIFFSTLGTTCFSTVGIFYNKELLGQAGITCFPSDWEGFWAMCDELQAAGITPLGLHTEGTAWTPMLLATAYVARTREGREFINTVFPASYDNEYGRELTEVLLKLFRYTTADAVNNNFDVAEGHFLNGEVAMLPNGFWELEQFSAEMKEIVGFAPFPQNIVIASPAMSGWVAASSYEEDIIKGAATFLKYRTLRGYRQKMELINAFEKNQDTAEGDYVNVITAEQTYISNYQMNWNSVLQDQVLGEMLPKLINGEIAVQDFIAAMDRSIAEYNSER